MGIVKVLTSSAAAASLLLMVPGAAFADTPSAASRLSVVGTHAFPGSPGARDLAPNDCITRPGKDGKWLQDALGKWVRCKGVAGGAAPAGATGGGFLAGNGLYVLLGLGALGGGLAAALGGPASP